MTRYSRVLFLLLCLQGSATRLNSQETSPTFLLPMKATMVTAWDYPLNPLTDSSLDAHPEAETIRLGFNMFLHTQREAPLYSPNGLSCNNCHLNAGQKEGAMPLVGVAKVFPEYNKRSGKEFTLEDRIVGCFQRSQNATGGIACGEDLPPRESREVSSLAAYIRWISSLVGTALPWRGKNVIARENLIPLEKLSLEKGKRLFLEKCISCHGEDGQGVDIGDKRAGPLWGLYSWNDGAGAARVYTLAGMIRYAMPYLDPGSLTDEEALQIANFICSQPRPVFPYKIADYNEEPLPVDAVYYMRNKK